MLQIEGLVKRFASKAAVDHVSLQLEQGKIYGLLGPNGSGKTTLMKLVSGLLKPSEGQISVDGHDIGEKSKAAISYMPTENYIYEFMKVKMVRNYFKDLYKDFDVDTFNRLIMELDIKEEDKVGSLSSGQKNRLKLAVSLARRAKLVMLDEPLNGIDLISREKIIKCIINEADETQTILISSHLVNEIEQILDEVIMIKDGEIMLKGDSDDLRSERSMSITGIYKEVFGA